MKRLNRVIASVGVLASLFTGASCIVAGCGGDDGFHGEGDGGTDGTVDAPNDVITDHNVSDVKDVSVPDAADGGADAKADADANAGDAADAKADVTDANVVDAADAADANVVDAADAADANVVDAADAADANIVDAADANVEDAADANDANIEDAAEAGFDAQVLYDFRDEIATKYCGQWGFCCFGADAAAFDLDKCKQTQFTTLNTLGNLGRSVVAYDGGNTRLNDAAAQACRDDITAPNFACTSIPASYFTKLFIDCAAAIEGLVPPASVCHDFFECAGDDYCTSTRPDVDGVCVPIASAGEACTTAANYECTKNGFGTQSQYCTATAANPTGTCQPLKPAGQVCGGSNECISLFCNSATPKVCADIRPVFISPLNCSLYTKDGG